MRILFFLAVFFASFSIASAADQGMVACTMEYAPVCGQPPMPKCPEGMSCIQMMPIPVTYGNKCAMNAAGATMVHAGECKGSNVIDDTVINEPVSSGSVIGGEASAPIVGGDVDKYGCKGSAGYQWNALANKCIRPWESRIRTLTIGPKLVDCTGVSPMQCMQVKSGLKWQNFYSSIEGFEFVPGYTYRIQVLETKIENPPMDASSRSYELVKILSKRPTAKTLKDTPLHGEWKLQAYNSKKVSGNFTANFESKRASFRFCNTMSGEYTLNKNVFSTPGFMQTEMYCEGIAMTLEDNFQLDGASYSLISTKSIPAQHILTITTKAGNAYVFRK